MRASNNYIKLDLLGYLRHFYVVFILSFFLVSTGINVLVLVQRQAWNIPWFWIVLPLSLILLIAARWLIMKLSAQLRFDWYTTSMTAEEFRMIVHLTADELNWNTIKLNDQLFEGERPMEGMEGAEWITIKRTGTQIAINSIPHPQKRSTSPSFVRNNENKRTLIYNAAAFMRGEDVFQLIEDRKKRKEEAAWTESEWTPKNLARRLLAYGFIALFLLLAWASVHEAPLLTVLFLVIGGGLGGMYIWSDVKVILRKRAYRIKQ